MLPTERAYAAGLFDGEGCITIVNPKSSHSGRRYHRLNVTVGQADPSPLMWLQKRWPGTISANHKPKNRIVWQWRVTGAKAGEFLQDIREYLVLKAPQADVAFLFRATALRRRNTMTREIFNGREDLRRRLSGLKVVP